ncbi:Galactoside 3(4)-L-fucosyltransferase, partial [Armadillidium vulgare]
RTNTSRLFEDEYFKVNLNQFKRKNLKHSVKSFRSGKTPKFLLVTKDKIESNSWKFELRHISSNECPLPCKITGNVNETSTADAIVLYIKHLKDRHHVQSLFPNRDYRQPWIMLTLESPLFSNSIYKTKYEEFNNLFNRTMMYRKDADIIVNHGFVKMQLSFHFIGVYHQNLPVPSIKVDIYGLCGPFKCGHSMYGKDGYNSTTDKCLKKIGTNYMFYLAFENSFCTDYGTEKIYNLLYYPIIPIVFGGINYKEILPPHSFINAADFSPFKLANYIKFLAQNPREI